MKSLLKSSLLTLPLLLPTAALADERPPSGAKPLSSIIQDLEKQGFTPVLDVSLDHGHWEVEALKGTERRELKVDPVSGKILSDRPDH